ncbi:hypothetical protein ACM26V_15230 [Salipaludibacillus sp. HK11]
MLFIGFLLLLLGVGATLIFYYRKRKSNLV